MKNSVCSVIFFTLLFQLAHAEETNYAGASEIMSGRVGASLVRYVKTFESECLIIEVLKRKDWTLLSGRYFCTFEGKSFSTDFTDIEFQNITFEKDGVHSRLSITPLRSAVEEIRSCIIPVGNDHIGDLRCSSARKTE